MSLESLIHSDTVSREVTSVIAADHRDICLVHGRYGPDIDWILFKTEQSLAVSRKVVPT